MKLYLKYVPCYIRQILDSVKMVTDDKKLLEHILRESLAVASEFDSCNIGLLTQVKIQRIIKELLPNSDPYSEIKKRFNFICLELEEKLKIIIKESYDPFETSLRISLAGNIIDFGPKQNLDKKVILGAIKKAISNYRKKGVDKIILCSDCKQCSNNTIKFVEIGSHDKIYKR